MLGGRAGGDDDDDDDCQENRKLFSVARFSVQDKTINVDTKVKFANYRPANFFNYHYIFCSIQPLYHFTLISLVL